MKSFDREAFTKTSNLVFVVLLKNSLSTHKESQKFVLSTLLFLLYFGLLISKVQAQIVPDSTLPVNSQVTPSGNIRTIDGGTRAGNNLFHSFQEFSVPTGIEAFFNNAVDVQNIFSRVTGRSISNIDGLIRANGTANLFLLNPNGIIFGPNARLNIGGSFLGSTANSIKFGDGIEFSATNPQGTPLLSVNVPIGLQYGKSTGEIRIQGKGQQSSFGATERFSSELNPLEVLPGKSLTFVGGNIIVEGGILQAPGGRVELGGLAGEGTVGINADGSLSFPNNSEIPVTLANVTINNKAGINVLNDGSGSITINANNLDISGNSLLSAGIATSSPTVANTPGNINFNAAQGITITSSRVENKVNPAAQEIDVSRMGNSGDIIIKTGFLYLTEYAQLRTSTFGKGDAGNVKVAASSLVLFNERAGAYSTVEIGAEGKAGGIEISAKSVSLSNDAQIDAGTFGKGDAGTVRISASDKVTFDNSSAFSDVVENAEGKGGNIEISTRSIFVTGGSQLQAKTDGIGTAGKIIIEADTVTFDGSEVFSSVASNGVGNAGGIYIKAGSLLVTNGTQIDAGTFGKGDAGNITIKANDNVIFDRSNAFSQVGENATGKGGNIEITTKSLLVTGGSTLQAQSSGTGDAGNITIEADDTVTFDGSNAYSSLEPKGDGNAGVIYIETGSLFLKNGATLQTLIRSPGDREQPPKGDRNAGIITIKANDLVSISGNGTGIFSNLQEGANNNSINEFAGNIFGKYLGDNEKIVASIAIEGGRVEITDGATLTTSSWGEGNAGGVLIVANDSVKIAGNNTKISSEIEKNSTGDAGAIVISGKLISLTEGASVSTSSAAEGKAGIVVVSSTEDNIFLNNSTISSEIKQGATGNAGAILIGGKSVSLTSGAKLITSSSGQGNAGIVVVVSTQDSISLNNSSIFSDINSGAKGNAGGIVLSAGKSLSLTNGSKLTSLTSGKGDAGAVILGANNSIFLDYSYIFSNVEEGGVGNGGKVGVVGRSLSLKNGSQIQTVIRSEEPVTDGQRFAGNILIQVSGDISLSGSSPPDLAGKSGSFPSLVASTVQPNAIGSAGNISISARSIWLNKGTGIIAATQAGEGGSIELKAGSVVVLRNGQITTTAIEAGKGGNITINTDGLVGIKNSDITSNAGTGSGGTININARSGSLGIQPRTREELAAQIGTNIDSKNIVSVTNNLFSSDVTAISGEPGLDGKVTFNTAVFQVIPLNQQLALPPLVPQACRSKIADGSEFIITGRGGLPINPIESIADEAIWIDLRVATEPSTKSAGRTQTQSKVSPSSTTSEIIEAQGWEVNPQGQVVLVADTSTATPQSPTFFLPQECQQQ